MSWHIHVPLKVVAPPEVDLPARQGLRAAVAAAVARALATARVRLPGEERPLSGVLEQPRVAHSGSAGRARLRGALADAVRAGIEDGVRLAGLEAVPLAMRPTAELPAGSSDALTRRRGPPATAARRPGARRSAEPPPLLELPPLPAEAALYAEVSMEAAERREPAAAIPARDALAAAWDGHSARFGDVWLPEAHGYPGFHGRFSLPDGTETVGIIWISAVRAFGADGRPSPFGFDYRWQPLELLDVEGSADRPRMVWREQPRGQAASTLVSTGREATVDNLLDALDAVLAEVGAAAPDAYRDEGFRRLYARRLAEPGAVLFRHESDAGVRLVTLPRSAPTRLNLVSAPPPAPPAERPPGPAPAEGAGETWAIPGPGGDPLTCAPFHGEPSLDELVAGRPALEEPMRELADLLAVPFCGYPGRFAINAVFALRERARAAGLASVSEEASTTVVLTPAGGGNLGLVAAQPAASPTLESLKRVAEAVPVLSALGDRVSDVYHLPANRPLLQGEGGASGPAAATTWALRFYRAFTPELDWSCAQLYAEACRIILLQQLRSSRRAIDARRAPDRFADTLAAFNAKLGTLGGRVVNLLIVKRALRYWRLEETNEALARSALFPPVALAPPPPARATLADYVNQLRDAYTAATHADPGILLAPADIQVKPRGDELVALWDGREWTDTDLDREIGIMRGLLNLVEPLFIQVEDIEPLHNRFVAERASTEHYLRGLLTEMAWANARITAECSDPNDGAFFALETSQWVAAENRWTNRGLRYRLEGIHKLADAELRSHARDDARYRAGIQLAIGRRAGLDDMIGFLSVAGVIVLAVACAPLGAAAAGAIAGGAGLGFTLLDVERADVTQQTFRALEQPESIVSAEEVRLAQITATLGVAFSVFDAIGVGKGMKAALSAARSGFRRALAEGVGATARASVRSAYETVLRNLADDVMRLALRQGVMELGVNAVMERVLPHVLQPVLAPALQALALERGSGVDLEALRGLGVDVDAALQAVEGPPAGEAAAPEEPPGG